MNQDKNNKVLTTAIILISILGAVYFWYQSIVENSNREIDNPHEYNVQSYKETDTNLISYSEIYSIDIKAQNFYGIDIDEKDNLYLSADNQLTVYSSSNQIIKKINLNDKAYCVEVSNGKIFLGMADHIEVYDLDGNRLAVWESLGNEAIITSIVTDDENLYAADAGNLVIIKYDLDGNIVAEIGKKDETKDIPGYVIPSPYFDIDIDTDGFLWAANTGRHSLENYTADGSMRTSWEKAGMEVENFSGCCNPSHFKILSDGSFVTSEKGIIRVKVYNIHGVLTDVVAAPKDFIEGTFDLDIAVDSKDRIFLMDPEKKQIRIFSKK